MLLGLQEVEAPNISKQSAHEGAQIVIPPHWPPLPRTVIPGIYFC